jgi:hypothetical protein
MINNLYFEYLIELTANSVMTHKLSVKLSTY